MRIAVKAAGLVYGLSLKVPDPGPGQVVAQH